MIPLRIKTVNGHVVWVNPERIATAHEFVEDNEEEGKSKVLITHTMITMVWAGDEASSYYEIEEKLSSFVGRWKGALNG